MKEELQMIRKRALELDKFKRKELEKIALEFGLDCRNYTTTNLTQQTYYGGITKLEVIFIIIGEEIRRNMKVDEE